MRWSPWGSLALKILGLALAILALSGPRWPDPESRIPTEGISIAMVVDVSASMGQDDYIWDNTRISRLDGVKKLFHLFIAGGEVPGGTILPGRPHDLVALVTFGTHPETACPLTLDHGALLNILQGQEPRLAADEGTTNPGDAIAWTLHVLQQAPTRRKVLVFLTDGESNVPEKLTPRQAAQLAANLSIPIYAIDASPEPAEDAKPGEPDDAAKARAMMQSLARMTDGKYFRAQDSHGLLDAYESVDRLERERILSFYYARYHEGFVGFAVASLACWLTLVILESTCWRKVP